MDLSTVIPGPSHPPGWAPPWLLQLAAAALGVCGAVLVRNAHQQSVANAAHLYLLESHQRSAEVAARVERAFGSMYEGLRTIARLPGVRSIDRHAHNFDADARQTVQEIYNDLASHVAMSEVYIVPLDMQPDEPDPSTGRAQTPITTFDELIVGRTADRKEKSEAGDGPEEVEIYEYRLMRRQMDWMAARCPLESAVAGLDYPAVTGPEVITCDNTRYSPSHPDDRDRSGLVYSVPFYGPDGRLRGCISGVILSHALRDLVPSGGFALRNVGHDYTIASAAGGPGPGSAGAVRGAVPDPSLVYSEVFDLKVPDGQPVWRLWAGRPDSDLWSRADVRGAGVLAIVEYGAVGAITAGLIGCIELVGRSIRAAGRHATELEARVAERTAALGEAMRAADGANRAKSEFLANMSHEIRTPMTAILGYADLLLDPCQTPADRTDSVKIIRRSGRHLLAIINDILDLSKIEAGRMTLERIPLDPCQLLAELASIMRHRAAEKGIAFAVEFSGPVPRAILSDPLRVRQVLMNLVGNAVKFTDSGSVRVVVGLRQSPAGGGTSMVFQVADTGPGMSPGQVAGLFRAFTQADASTTRRHGGTGLGLAISRHLSQLLGGSLDAASTPGVGSTFTFSIPIDAPGPDDLISSPTLAVADEPAALPPVALALRGRILLAEDGPDNQRLFCYLLRRAGAEVRVVENGREAADAALEAVAAGSPFGLILMDMQMPILDGYGAVTELRARGYAGPIVALTANAMVEDRLRCEKVGCDAFLTKPIERTVLLEACAAWLGHEAPAPA